MIEMHYVVSKLIVQGPDSIFRCERWHLIYFNLLNCKACPGVV